jgi:O-antigen/teichoic acid export membrane protein
MPLPVSTLVPTTVGYGLLILLSNLDVLLSYLVLSSEDLGLYSASSVFPKAILVVITPLLQMLFPMMLTVKADAPQFDFTIAKIGGVVLLLTSIGAGIIWLLSGWLCGGAWGLKLCEPGPMHVLLLSTLPLVLLRVLVTLQFARGHDLIALWLGIPVATYFFIIANSQRTVEAVAKGFTVFSAGACIFFLAICFLAARVRRPQIA